MQAHRSLMLLVECLAMAPVVPGESVPWGGDGHGFCVSNRPPTRPLPPANSTARRSPKLLVNCELKLQLALSSRISFCRCSRAEGGGSATVPFRLWMRGGTGLSRLARLLSLRPCPYIRWWHSRRRLSATASPRQHLPAAPASQPFYYYDLSTATTRGMPYPATAAGEPSSVCVVPCTRPHSILPIPPFVHAN